MHMTALLITLPSITLCSDCARGDRCQGRALSAEQTQRMTFMASQHTASSYWERLVRRTRRAMPSWWITSLRQAPSGEAGRTVAVEAEEDVETAEEDVVVLGVLQQDGEELMEDVLGAQEAAPLL